MAPGRTQEQSAPGCDLPFLGALNQPLGTPRILRSQQKNKAPLSLTWLSLLPSFIPSFLPEGLLLLLKHLCRFSCPSPALLPSASPLVPSCPPLCGPRFPAPLCCPSRHQTKHPSLPAEPQHLLTQAPDPKTLAERGTGVPGEEIAHRDPAVTVCHGLACTGQNQRIWVV